MTSAQGSHWRSALRRRERRRAGRVTFAFAIAETVVILPARDNAMPPMSGSDDSNPIARQLSGRELPPRKKGGNVRRRVPLWRRRWFVVVAVMFLLIGVTALAVLVAFLKPLRDQAESFDLALLHKIEQASLIYDRTGSELGRIYV